MVSPDAAEDPAKANYRTMGRGHGGVLKKRYPRFVRDFSMPASSTIPPKFETVLYRDNRERTGFNQHTPRFQDHQREQLPGPGSYGGSDLADGSRDTMNQQAGGSSSSGSTGRRGTSSFAARGPRLQGAGTSCVPPGPGAYDATAAPARGRAEASAAFVLPGSVNPLKLCERPAPGPGDYGDASKPRSARGPRLPVNTCNSHQGAGKDGRLHLDEATSSRPGPGHYEVTSSPRASSLPPKGWTIGSSKRRLVPRTPDAAADRPFRGLLKTGAEMLSDKAAGVAPGPGDYDPKESEGPRHVSKKGLSCFQAGHSHFPRQWRPTSPGPGDYSQAVPAEAPKALARASFVSASPRFHDKAEAVPGPTHYSPRTRCLASFHLNLKGSWI